MKVCHRGVRVGGREEGGGHVLDRLVGRGLDAVGAYVHMVEVEDCGTVCKCMSCTVGLCMSETGSVIGWR